jgi:nicotinate-nucleotide adenylyltransferase
VKSISALQKDIDIVFKGAFGRTPLVERLNDVSRETSELTRFIDLENLQEEGGDLLCSVLQLFSENKWDVEQVVKKTLTKIKRRQRQYGTLGRKTKVAILGGAFDPIHVGHIQVAQAVLNYSKAFDEVWLCPCFCHLYGKKMTAPKHRLEMCRLAAQVDGRIKVFDYEIKNKFKGETYHFMKSLLEEDFAKNEYNFSLIIGQDNAQSFDRWYNYELLERMCRFIVVPRQGVSTPKGDAWYLKPPHIYLAPDEPIMRISSTRVREMFQSSRGICSKEVLTKVLNSKVLAYIFENKLYQ